MIAWLKEEHLSRVPRPAQWLSLLLLSVVFMVLLEWFRLPAALLLGAMFAGILIETGGGEIRVPALPFQFSQAVIGCLVASRITPQILKTFEGHWPLFLGVMLAVIVASCGLGWLLHKFRVFPDTTPIWGLLPGAASTMMIMADSFGADGRLVAFMQYLRVVCVALAGSVIARFWCHASVISAPVIWFPEIQWPALAETLLFIGLCIYLGKKSGIPAGGILVPLVLGTILKDTGSLNLELPPWLLAVSYALLGWSIGLRFTRKILVHAARALPQITLSVLLLMAFCGGLAAVLVEVAGIDPLTAYLATSPGGVDSAAIIAASSKVDLPFVMSMQTARLLMVLFIGPVLSRRVAGAVTKVATP
ncbi:MAG: AbrB family transcriptional regulator [Verrucomicrobiae bacterium]|nr:AbrB family transcriptional regulator [Verrucomicrobiae bacterium]